MIGQRLEMGAAYSGHTERLNIQLGESATSLQIHNKSVKILTTF